MAGALLTLYDLIFLETFWYGAMAWVALASLCLMLLVAIIARRIKNWRHIHKDEAGAVLSMDVVLVAPIALFIVSLAVQALVLSHQSIILHSAAFAAARSALVHQCPENSIMKVASCALKTKPGNMKRAAETMLIAAAPSSSFAVERNGCPSSAQHPLSKGLPLLADGAGIPVHLKTAIRNKICYILEPGNVSVETKWVPVGTALALTGIIDDPPPVEAEVRYRYALTTPIGGMLAGGTRSDGTKWREGVAKVVLR